MFPEQNAVVFTIAMSYEWYGLYNPAGFLVYEGHDNLNSSIDYAFIANLIGFGIHVTARTVDENWLNKNQGYPERLEDVVWSGTWK
jgi:hypothetical protein